MGGEICVVEGCNHNSAKKVEGVRFHKFPFRDKELLQKWISAIGREGWTPRKSSVVCNSHFREGDYNPFYEYGRHMLKHCAVPSIFSHSKNTPKHVKRPPTIVKVVVPKNTERHVATRHSSPTDTNPVRNVNISKIVSENRVQPAETSSISSETVNFHKSTTIPQSRVFLETKSIQTESFVLPFLKSTASNSSTNSCKIVVPTRPNTPITVSSVVSSKSKPIAKASSSFKSPPSLIAQQARDKTIRRKVKLLQQQNRRKADRIMLLKANLKEARRKSPVAEIFASNFDGFLLEFIRTQYENTHSKDQCKSYCETIKQFALTMHHFSPKGYDYLRTLFHLPHPSRIRQWLCKKKRDMLKEMSTNIPDNEKVEMQLHLEDAVSILEETQMQNEDYTDSSNHHDL